MSVTVESALWAVNPITSGIGSGRAHSVIRSGGGSGKGAEGGSVVQPPPIVIKASASIRIGLYLFLDFVSDRLSGLADLDVLGNDPLSSSLALDDDRHRCRSLLGLVLVELLLAPAVAVQFGQGQDEASKGRIDEDAGK